MHVYACIDAAYTNQFSKTSINNSITRNKVLHEKKNSRILKKRNICTGSNVKDDCQGDLTCS